jgi:chromosome segregation ATPase
LATAQLQLERARDQARDAKRKRKEAKEAARESRKQAKRARAEFKGAQQAVTEAEISLANALRRARAKRSAQIQRTRAAAPSARGVQAPKSRRTTTATKGEIESTKLLNPVEETPPAAIVPAPEPAAEPQVLTEEGAPNAGDGPQTRSDPAASGAADMSG